ncbi:hypothetical protein JHK86_010064 [Glycine max]|nr:hypothetical protein JHK86_010064 [Glycine max]
MEHKDYMSSPSEGYALSPLINIFPTSNVQSFEFGMTGPLNESISCLLIRGGDVPLSEMLGTFSLSVGAVFGSTNGWIELVVIEARDLIAADLRGTSDPYVRVNYGNSKKRTKMSDKWIPLQGVKSGEIHIQITRKVPEMQTRHTLDSHPSSLSKSHQIPTRER